MRRPGLWLLAFVLLVAANHLLWVAWDGRPPAADQAVHLESALRCARVLGEGAWREMLFLSGYYPPLTHCAAGLLHHLFGPSRLVAHAFIQGTLALIVFSTYWIGVRLGTGVMGVAGALLVAAYTAVFLETRAFMLDLPLTALVTLTILALLQAGGFAHLGWSLVAGGLAGLGLLTKWTYPFFLVPVALFLWIRGRRDPDRPARWTCLLAAVGVMALIACPWYLLHPALAANLLKNAYVAGAAEGDPGVTSLAGWGYYLWGLRDQLGAPFALFFAVGLGCAWAWRIRGLGLLLVWVVVPMALFTLFRNKDYRYTIPTLPAVALLSVAWLGQLRPRWAARAVGVLAALVLAHMALLGWGWPPEWARGRMDRTLLFPSFPPISEHWPIADILGRIARDQPMGSGPVRLSVVPDHPSFSRFNFRYYAVLDRRALRVVKAWTGPPLFIDYVVTKTGDQGPPHTTGEAQALMGRIARGDPTLAPLLHRVGAWPLPDGSRATLYKVAARPLTGVTASAVEARLREATPKALAWAVGDARGLEVGVEPFTDADTLEGRFRRLIMRIDSARVGDFRRKPTALNVQGAELVVDDVRVNPHSLVARGAVDLLSARRLTIRRAAASEGSLTRLLADVAPWVTAPAVSVKNGRVEVAGGVRGIRIEVALRLDLVPEGGGGVAVWVDRVRMGRVPLPARVVNLILALANPVVRLDEQPLAIDLPRLELDEGVVRLVSS